MPYFCQQCGECCSVMGQVFSIVEKLDEYQFRFRNEYTGDTRVVEVAPHLRALFNSHSISASWENPCPFLRQDPDGRKAFCTVHLTRPDMCREYQCWRILVLDVQGNRVARVMDRCYLCIEDECIRESWEEFRENLNTRDIREWDSEVIRFFRDRGYLVRV